jgi:prepilin-type N-terminal cleavage/methylation domain-containing protein
MVSDQHARLWRAGPAGFTLIEILIVVVVIAILAALAIPRYQRYRANAYAATIKSDLRKIAVAQEDFFSSHNRFASTPPFGTDTIEMIFSPGVQAGIEGNDFGWRAKATHPLANPLICAVFWGKMPLWEPAVDEGQPACR